MEGSSFDLGIDIPRAPECSWCCEPITDGNLAVVTTTRIVRSQLLTEGQQYYHWTPGTYEANVRGDHTKRDCLWHSHQQGD